MNMQKLMSCLGLFLSNMVLCVHVMGVCSCTEKNMSAIMAVCHLIGHDPVYTLAACSTVNNF